MKLALLAPIFLLSGCGWIPFRPSIKSHGVSVVGTKDAGKPATLASDEKTTTLEIPAGTPVLVTSVAAVPATAHTAEIPAREEIAFTPAQAVAVKRQESTVRADTGTVDTSVAIHRIDAADRKWLLFAAIGCGVAGIVFKSLLPAWPAISNGLLIAAPCAFAAWKLSEVPAWLWATVVAGVLILALGYKRAEWDANKNYIPDALEKK